jgi:hypothetical protein
VTGRQTPLVTKRGPQSQPYWYGALRVCGLVFSPWSFEAGSSYPSVFIRGSTSLTAERKTTRSVFAPGFSADFTSTRQVRNMLSAESTRRSLTKTSA